MIELRLSDYSRQEPPTGIAYASVRVASPSATAHNMSSAPVSDDTLLPPEFRIAAFSAPGVEVAPIGISQSETDTLRLEVNPSRLLPPSAQGANASCTHRVCVYATFRIPGRCMCGRWRAVCV